MHEVSLLSAYASNVLYTTKIIRIETRLDQHPESISVSQVLPIVVWVGGVDHDEKKLLEQRCSPHHASILVQLEKCVGTRAWCC